jgi:hypothetical protein
MAAGPSSSSADATSAAAAAAAGGAGAGPLAGDAAGAGGGGGGGGGQPSRSRCYSCRKKVGLTGFECRCGFVFCGQHRYADQHSCGFDYRAHDRALLAKANPKVAGQKVDQI